MRKATIGHYTGQVVQRLWGGGQVRYCIGCGGDGGRASSAGAVEGEGVALLACSPLTSRQLTASTGHRISLRNAAVAESDQSGFTSR